MANFMLGEFTSIKKKKVFMQSENVMDDHLSQRGVRAVEPLEVKFFTGIDGGLSGI